MVVPANKVESVSGAFDAEIVKETIRLDTILNPTKGALTNPTSQDDPTLPKTKIINPPYITSKSKIEPIDNISSENTATSPARSQQKTD